MNAEGKRDVCGQKHERKSTRSFSILCSGGRIYFLACTADAPFLWVSFPYVSCQARVLMKQNDTGSLSLTPLHPSNSQSVPAKSVSLSLFLSLFPKNKIRYVRSCLIQAWRKCCVSHSRGLPAAAKSGIVSTLSWVCTLNSSSNLEDL